MAQICPGCQSRSVPKQATGFWGNGSLDPWAGLASGHALATSAPRRTNISKQTEAKPWEAKPWINSMV
jgi:hypothetical protein